MFKKREKIRFPSALLKILLENPDWKQKTDLLRQPASAEQKDLEV